MRKIYLVLFSALFLCIQSYAVSVTVTNPTNATPALAASYTTLASAITALNTVTSVSGPVVLTCAASGSETTPAGGFTINYNATGLSATNNIIIDGNGSTITAFTPQASGILHDAIFEVLGSDWLTIQGFTMLENAANTTTAAATNNMTEWGVALLYLTSTNGAQNCTIKNNTIDLNRTYQNTFGIYSNSTHTSTAPTTGATATTTAGANSGLVITGNTITDVNNGICIVGPTAAADHNNGIIIGGTAANANTLTNYGTTGTFSGYSNVTGTVNGISVRNSINIDISHNSITSSNGGTTVGTLRGIFVPSFSNANTATSTNRISRNSISIRSGVAAGAMNNLLVEVTTFSNTSTLNIDSNDIHTTTHSVAASGAITFISTAIPVLTCNIRYNTFTNVSVNTTGSLIFISHSYSIPANGFATIANNSIVGTFAKTGAGGTNRITVTNGSSPNSATCNYLNNNFSNITLTGATSFTGFNNTDGLGTSPNKTITNNRFSNWTTGAGTLIAMNFTYWGGTSNISFDTITNFSAQGAITGLNIGNAFATANPLQISNNFIQGLKSTGVGGLVEGISSSNTSTQINIFNNIIDTLNNSTAASTNIFGINITGATKVNIYNNTIKNLLLNGATTVAPNIAGIRVTAGINDSIYGNTIFNANATGTSSTGVIARGIQLTAPTTPWVYNNNIYDISSGNSNGNSTEVIGIGVGNVVTGSNVFNNFITNITASSANSANAIKGIELTGTGVTHAVYYNTIRLTGLSSAGATFGGAGVQYPNSASGSINVRNNIVYVNATANGTGLFAAVRRAGGTAATKPANFQGDNNIYYINPSASNYLYVEGVDNTTCVNGFGISGLTNDLVRRIANDASFNTSCGLYKAFMKTGTPYEQNTFNENNLASLGTTPPTFAPSGTSYAENSAQSGLTPNITTDYSNVNRTPTNDRGALQFSGNNIDASAPTISYTNLRNPVCTNNQVLTAVIKDANGMVATGAGVRPRMYYKRNLNTDTFNVAFNNNTFNGWKYVEGVQMNASDTLWQFTIDYSLLDGGAVAVGDSFKYFVVAQDTATPAVNVGTNTINFPSIYCPSSVAIDNFATIPSSAIGAIGAKQDTIKSLPNPITISATNTTICVSGSTLLTSSLFTAGLKVDSTYWEESTDSITFSTISSSNKDTITQNLSGSTKYFRQVVMCGSSPVDTTDAIKIKVNNPQVLSVKGDTICGSDTAHLSATVSSGDTAIWYKTPTSTARLKVGNTLDTFLSANDTFYVAANTNPALTALTTFGAGGGTSNASGSPFYYTWGGSKTQYIILASELASAGFSAGNISSLALNISSIGNMNVNDTLYISMGSTSQTSATSTHVSGTTLVYFSATGLNITSTGWNTFNFSTPYNWNGTSNLVVQFAWSRKNSGSAPGATVVTNNTGATLNTYSYADGVAASAIFNTLTGATGGSGGTSTTTIRPQFKFGVQVGGCQSARTQVIVIRNTPPTIAATAPTFICTGQSAALNVTSTNDPNYKYTWNPGALIGAAQSVSPVATTTYTVNAIDTTTGCATSKDTIVQVRPYPTKPILNVDSVYVCSNAIQTLTVTNPFLAPNISTTSSVPLSLLFPDASSAGTSTTLSVAGIPSNAIIDSMAVMVTIKTTFVGDVELNLQAPNGQIVNLIADNAGGDDDFTNTRISSNNSNPALPTLSGSGQAPFSNTYRATATANTNLIAALSLPTTTLMSNLWTTPNGTWTLRCYDDASGDFDTLKSWTIQIYYRSPCNYSWTPAANLYTDAPATINYTSGDSLTLYAKNTSNTNYITTATLNGCSTSDTAKYTIKNSSQSVVLAGGPLSGVTLAVDCEEGNWTYYADPLDNTKWLIAIDWNGTNNAAAKASASVTLQVGSMYQDTAIRRSGYSDGAFIMGRYWNVALSGGNTINPAFPVKVRFYYDQSDLNAVETARDNAISNWNGGNPTRLAYPTPIRWFKTVGTAFDPAILASDGNKFTDTTVTLDTGATGFHNGVQYIEHHNITSFSGGGVGFGMSQYPSNTLPVTLINFGGNVAQDHNHIKWVTASEINNDRFELQSSHNGREFNTIATISGHGNSTEINEYSFNDYQYHAPTSYYRLNQIDFDGTATLSNIISLTRSAIGTSTVVSMYPNPTQHNVTLSIQVGNTADATITVYDASGKVVLTNTMVCNKGNNSTQLDISSLADGVYIVDVLVQGEHIKSRLVKTH